MDTDREYDIADLHEDVLEFLLHFQEENIPDSRYDMLSEYGPLFFLVRSKETKEDLEALQKGWWFHGNEKYVHIYFAENIIESNGKNNFRLSINKRGEWSAEIQEREKKLLGEDLRSNLFVNNFNHLGKTSIEKKGIEEYQRDIYLKPNNKYYREGLLEALHFIYQQLKRGVLDQPWLDSIDPEEFKRRLEWINKQRKPQTQFSLASLSIKNYRGLKNASLSDIPLEAPWIFLTGENGFGKTSFLQAIAIGLYGNTEDVVIPKDKKCEITTSYRWKNKIRTNLHHNNIRQTPFFRPLETLACYGSARLELQSHQSRNEEAKNATATYSLFNTDGILKNIEYELLLSFYENKEQFKMLEQLLKAVVPSLHKIEVDKSERQILYYEKDEREEETVYEPVSFNQLASGIRSIIAMTGDIYLRLNETLRREAKKSEREDLQSHNAYYRPDELSGVVIIDELDLHLHPDWQYKLPGLLSEVFPKIQFIASTHSPIPLLGAPENSVFIKVDRTQEAGITVKKLDVDLSNLTPNLILTSEIFGFHNVIAKSNIEQKQVRTEDTMEEKTFRDELKKRLVKFAEEEGDYPKNLFKE